MRPSLRFLLAVALVLSLSLACTPSCGPSVTGPMLCTDPGTDDGGPHLDGGPPAALAVTFGDETSSGDAVMTPWVDGASVTRVHGSQGGTMLTPALDVVAPPATVPVDASGTACFHVHIVNTDTTDASKSDTYDVAAEATAVAGRSDAWHVTSMLDRLFTTVDSSTLDVEVTVSGTTSLGTAHARVMPH